MSVLPNPFIVLRARWQTARIARRLKRPGAAIADQQRALRALLEKIALAAYGCDLGITAGMTYADFRARVPIRDHAQLEPYFRRIKRGEPNVLWPAPCRWETFSAGTTGQPKWLPVTEASIEHIKKAETTSLLWYCARVGHSEVFRGRHLSLGRLLPLAAIDENEPSASPQTGARLRAIPEQPAWGDAHLAEPPEEIAGLEDWAEKTKAIIARTLRMNITLVAGLPNWLITFAEALSESARQEKIPTGSLKATWPNLECVVHHGVLTGPFHDELRRTIGVGVDLHEVYFAAEAFIAAQDTDAAAGLRLITDAGVFYEFLPLADFNETLPLTLGAKALSLEQVRVGEIYVVLITTPAGLCRYVLGDLVRFVSTEPPRIVHCGRTALRLNGFEENVIEAEITDALVAVCRRHDWTITNFHVAPLFSNSLIGQAHGRHEWWVELRPGTVETPTGPILAGHLDVELQSRNDAYTLKRQRGRIEAPVVRLVMPGFFAHWMRHQNRWGEQQKMPRCRSDRLIADEFTALACFNAD